MHSKYGNSLQILPFDLNIIYMTHLVKPEHARRLIGPYIIGDPRKRFHWLVCALYAILVSKSKRLFWSLLLCVWFGLLRVIRTEYYLEANKWEEIYFISVMRLHWSRKYVVRSTKWKFICLELEWLCQGGCQWRTRCCRLQVLRAEVAKV